MTEIAHVRVLSLSLLAALALATDTADAGPKPVPAAPESTAKPAPAGLPDAVVASLVTHQSLYVPCYALTPLGAGLREHWRPGLSSCYLLARDQTLHLAAPLQFPVAQGTMRVKALRCYVETDPAADEIKLRASVLRDGTGTVASLDETLQRGAARERVGAVNQALSELDPAKYHYDLSVNWRVNVPAGDGWLPDAHRLLGCRIDYTIRDLP
jgi:hypothetical protein